MLLGLRQGSYAPVTRFDLIVTPLLVASCLNSARRSVAKNPFEKVHRIGIHRFRKRYELRYRHLPLVALNHANHRVGSANTGRQLPLGQAGVLACFG